MKNIFLSIILIFGTTTLFAQKTPTFKWAKISEKDNRAIYDRRLLTSTDSEVIFAEEKLNFSKSFKKTVDQASSYDVVTYNKMTLKLKSRKTLELKQDGKKLSLIEVKTVQEGTTWIFSRFKNKNKKKYFLFVESFNPTTKKVNKDRKMIAERLDDLPSFAWDWVDPKFIISTSPNKSKILVVNKLSVSKKEKVKIVVAIFDQKMNPIWSKELELPSVRNDTKLGQIQVDNDGNVFFAGLVKKNNKVKKGEVNYHQKVYVFTNNGESRSIKSIRLGKTQWVADNGIMWPTKEGKLLYFTSYAMGKKSGDIGFLVAKYDIKTSQIEQTEKYKFPLKWVGKSAKEIASIKKNMLKKRFKYHNNLTLKKQCYNEDDGSSIIFLEEFKESSQGTSGGSMFKFKEAIIIRIDKNGTLVWQDLIDKRQKDVAQEAGSYVPIVKNGVAYILFNDSKKNVKNRKENKSQAKPSLLSSQASHALVLVSIDAKGNKKEQSIQNHPSISSLNFFKLSDSEYIIYAYKKGLLIGTITF